MAEKNMDISAPSISTIERPCESTLSVPVRDDCLLQANEEIKHKVDQLATELSALKSDITSPTMDPSDVFIGAVLKQLVDGVWQLVGFYSGNVL
ncbi:hypothetical protein MRX96_055768 [Rhipicephalus microplus]